MMAKRTFEEEIQQNGRLVYTNVGVSMLPLIRQHRDLVIVEKPKGRCKKYDVALYKKNGRYILHRVLEVRADDYVIRGDNCLRKEYGITDRQVIGVLSAVVRDGKTIPVGDWKYQVYSRLWHRIFWIRLAVYCLRAVPSWLGRKLKGRLSDRG